MHRPNKLPDAASPRLLALLGGKGVGELLVVYVGIPFPRNPHLQYLRTQALITVPHFPGRIVDANKVHRHS